MEEENRPKALMIPFDKFVILDLLSPEQYKNVLTRMRDYVECGKEPEGFEPIEQMAFEAMRPFMDDNVKKYQCKIDAQKKNGSKGGRPKKAEEPSETHGFSEEPSETHENQISNIKVQSSNIKEISPIGDTKKAAPADDDEEFSEIIRHYEQAIGSFPRSALDKLQKWRQVYSTEMLLLAIDKATEAGKRSWSYINGILSGWQRDGLHTPGDVAAANERYAAQRTACMPQRRNVLVSRPPEEAAKAGNFLADAAHRRPLRKKGEPQDG